MSELTIEERRRYGRKGGLTTSSRHNMAAVAAHARRSSPQNFGYWLDKVDPERVLDLSDRERRARAAQSLYFSELGKRQNKSNAGASTPRRCDDNSGGTRHVELA